MLNNPKNSGIVTIIGEVNVGKSSLLNILVKKDVSIITHKSNTTNKQIKGIKSYKNSQIIFIDTPGLYINKGKTNRNFLSEIWSAVTEADFLCIVVDGNRTVSNVVYQLLEQINEKNLPKKRIILAINKIDLISKDKLLKKTQEINEKYEFDKIFMISALKNDGIDDLLNWFTKHLPQKKWSYPPHIISDQSFDQQLNEKTRQIILLRIHDEIPYSIEVSSDNIINVSKSKLRIFQSIYVHNQRHRSILIGKKGETIKSISISARKKIEKFTNKKIDLFLEVKIKKKGVVVN
jgi:GTP-binding protein Era|tara:strand:+ start:570 stop:1445 length:876 start_codon:yes stop_codon:yes gene_type:complete